ncbi:hypothetical protein BGZ80_006983 [Entomortierella chlamydospora]|uniref:Uncharacterized protein n=1 Tax=Entomortierella chlamydospora TaxID=101097 RepID=A0A9P6MYJ5_9FUNG|nr:hypothetical protein BGZ79_007514 [Entomortierella chlamydospora]KAG0018601.1 hypothetical protein BGZ80_006983 [Entomortierella chlamydospora]
MLSRKALSAGIIRSATKATRQQQQTCAFSNSAMRQERQVADKEEVRSKAPPYRSARYLLEVAEHQQKGGRAPRRNLASEGSEAGAPTRRPNNRRSRRPDNESSSGSGIPPSRFKPQPTIAYDTTKELQFPDKIDWEVSSVFESRPLYANIAASRGTVAQLGTAAVTNPSYNPIFPGTAFAAHISGVNADGKLDPEVEQSLIQDIAPIQADKDKDHRKKSDVPSVENQPVLFRLTQNFQEVMNPRIAINKFNNGNVKHVAEIQYEIGSDDVQGAAASDDKQAEKSWKRLERLGGDYSRAAAPLSLLKESKSGEGGKTVMENVSQLLGQNQSIGLEDKKKFLKAVEKSLGGY